MQKDPVKFGKVHLDQTQPNEFTTNHGQSIQALDYAGCRYGGICAGSRHSQLGLRTHITRLTWPVSSWLK